MHFRFLLSFFFLTIFSTKITCTPKVQIKVVSNNEGLDSTIEDFTLANYGSIPYGLTIYSQVRLANPLNGCSSLQASETDQYSQILLMKRGDCTFLQKTKQAELSGAKILLVVDSREEQESEIVIVADHRSTAHIPTIMLEKTIGEKMIQILDSYYDNDPIVLSVEFPKPDQSTTAYVDFWLDSYDKQSYKFLKFAYQNSSLSKILSTDAVVFTPHYVIWYCYQCEVNDFQDGVWDDVNKFCISNGRYCNPDPDRSDFYNGPMQGADVVREDWRQICIYDKYRDQVEHDFDKSKWIQYMITFYDQCIVQKTDNIKQCGDDVMEQLQIPKSSIEKCYKDNMEDQNNKNTIIKNLEEQKKKFIEEEIMIWPSLFINNLTYRGDLESNETLETICYALQESKMPEECQQYLQTGEFVYYEIKKNKFLGWGIVLSILLFVAIFMIIFYYFYKRQIQKQIDREIQMQVDTRITQYFALQDQKK